MNRSSKVDKYADRSANFAPVNLGGKCRELLEPHGIETRILPVYNNAVRFFEESFSKVHDMDDATINCVFKEISLMSKGAIDGDTKRFIAKNKKKLKESSETREYVPKELKKWKGSTLKVGAPTEFIESI